MQIRVTLDKTMITRQIEQYVRAEIGRYPVITITGPRQSGKTTLIKKIFSDFPYFSLENPDTRDKFLQNPREMFAKHGHRIILDEVQRQPKLLSYIQGIVDDDRDACFVLSGSHNMLMMESVTQTLAGRVTIFYLQPLSYAELLQDGKTTMDKYELMWQGGYPRLYDRNLRPERFYQAYIETYVQRDVRQVKNIGNLMVFTQFLGVCASFIGQTINYSTLASAAGISQNTAISWISVLETSFITYQLQPFYKNFKKRIVKSSKLYFRDTGLACALLDINSPATLEQYYQKGAIFENFVINEVIKGFYNKGLKPPIYYWRDSNQREIDLLLNRGISLQPIEIKLGRTYRRDFFKHLDWFAGVSDVPITEPTVVWGADDDLPSESGSLLSWRNLRKIYD